MVNLWREKRVHSLLNEKQIREQSNYRGDIEVVQFSFEIYNEFTWVLPDKYETFVPLKDGLAPDVESPSIVKAGFFDFLRFHHYSGRGIGIHSDFGPSEYLKQSCQLLGIPKFVRNYFGNEFLEYDEHQQQNVKTFLSMADMTDAQDISQILIVGDGKSELPGLEYAKRQFGVDVACLIVPGASRYPDFSFHQLIPN